MTSFEGLCEILVKDYQRAPENLTPDTPLGELAIDSLGVIELIFAIEDKFKVVAGDADPEMARNFTTLQDVTDYIDRLVEQRDLATPTISPVDQPVDPPHQ